MGKSKGEIPKNVEMSANNKNGFICGKFGRATRKASETYFTVR